MRVEKVEQEIKKQVSKIFQQELDDPRIGFVTITRVKLSADLKFAKIYYTVLENKDKTDKAKIAISHASAYVRRLLAQRLSLRFVPEIKFFYDESFQTARKVNELLDKLKDEKSSS